MAKSFRRVDRDQPFLLPPDVREWLPAGHLVWFVISVVDNLDVAAFVARSRLGGAGRAGYDPRMLLTVLVYAYAMGERSSRQIERLCHTDVAFKVACALDVPDHTTIARFRKDHETALKDLFEQVLVLCAKSGLGRLGTVAIDGTKIAANASDGAIRKETWIREQAAQILAEAARADAEEDALFGEARGDELPEDLVDPRTREERILKALADIEAEAKAEATERARAEEEDRAKGEAYERKASDPTVPADRRGGRPPRGTDPVVIAQARLDRELARARPRARSTNGAAPTRRHGARPSRAISRSRSRTSPPSSRPAPVGAGPGQGTGRCRARAGPASEGTSPQHHRPRRQIDDDPQGLDHGLQLRARRQCRPDHHRRRGHPGPQ